MKIKIIVLLAILLFCSKVTLNGEITKEEICNMYSQIIYDLKEQVKRDYRQKELFVSNQIQILNDFPRFIEQMKPLFGNELEKRDIDYKQITNKMDSFNFKCFDKSIKVINAGDYYSKYIKNAKRQAKKYKGICFFSNIGYSYEFAFVEVIVQLSYSRQYSNFYFFKKETNWKLVYFREGCD